MNSLLHFERHDCKFAERLPSRPIIANALWTGIQHMHFTQLLHVIGCKK